MFDHLIICEAFPADYKRQLQDVVHRRKSFKDGGTSQLEEDRNHRVLVDFCSMRCQQAGIMDREDGEMVFHPNAGLAYSQLPPQPIQHPGYAALPPHHVSMRQPPPSYSDHAYTRGPYYGESQSSSLKSGDDENPLEPAPLSHAPHYPNPPYSPVPHDFPFFYQDGRWICKYCCHVPPQYRDPQSYWINNMRVPPPPNFIDYHLGVCREFQKTMYEQNQYHPRAHMASPAMAYSPGRPYQTPQPHPSLENGTVVSPPGMLSSPYHPAQIYPLSANRSSKLSSVSLQPAGAEDTAVTQAIEYLEKNNKSAFDSDGKSIPESEQLVQEEDRLLLTEYFYYMMKQLRPVRFSESDRRTRGGKREKIKVGYGGLQCVHCVDIQNSRKFFWSNVDRLANSFAEIPGHILKCRRCPQPYKDALLLLKQRHADQMSRLPRGSQKVFFRRMWNRLHKEDPDDHSEHSQEQQFMESHREQRPEKVPGSESFATRPPRVDVQLSPTPQDSSPPGTSGSEDSSIYFLQRPSTEAAKALADASMQPGPPSPNSRVLLAIPEDKDWLSDTDCFIRRQLEVFCTTSEDVEQALEDRKYPVKLGQIGIRCIHCALTPNGARAQAVAYPFSISGIYEAAREFQRLHLETCENLPLSAKSKLVSLRGSTSLSSVLRKYYVLAAKALGLHDTMNGIRAGGDAAPPGSQAAFIFSEASAEESNEDLKALSRGMDMRRASLPAISAKKRKAETDALENPPMKRPALPKDPSPDT
jgi:hypothetical protein